jgi:hypothetical protein
MLGGSRHRELSEQSSVVERSAGGRAIGPLYRPQSLIPLTLAPISLRSVRKTRPLPWFIARSIPTRAWSRGPRSRNSYGKAGLVYFAEIFSEPVILILPPSLIATWSFGTFITAKLMRPMKTRLYMKQKAIVQFRCVILSPSFRSSGCLCMLSAL